jgi:taurine dioxygenase
MTIKVEPVHDAIGARVFGVDLAAPMDDTTFAAVKAAHLRHGVLIFPDQKMTPEEHVAFTRRFGELEIHVMQQFGLPGFPEVLVLSNDKNEKGEPVGIEDAGRYWHTDMSYLKRPCLGSILYGIDVPPEGGDTMFAGMAAAYDGLPARRRAELAGLRAIHHFGTRWHMEQKKAGVRPAMSKEQLDKTPPVSHPVVRTHPETGRQTLYVGGFVRGIEGMSEADGQALNDELVAHATQPRFVYVHKWTKGDVVFWDNRCAMHHATVYEPRYRRHMNRTTIKGDEPFYRA